jgi:transposase
MPRKSPFIIVLSANERATLQKQAHKYTSSYRDVIRARIILYAADGLDNDEIATRVDLPRQIVSKWRKRFHEQRLSGLEERPRTGRPRDTEGGSTQAAPRPSRKRKTPDS